MDRRRFLLTSLAGAARRAARRRGAAGGEGLRGSGILCWRSADAEMPTVSIHANFCASSGYVEGQNLVFEFRYADGQVSGFRRLARRTRPLGVEVIFAAGPVPLTRAREARPTIPIVMLRSRPTR